MEDYEFWLSLLKHGREVFQIPEVLFHYRKKKKSRSTFFVEDVNIVKNTYRRIQLKHRKLYLIVCKMKCASMNG